MGVFTSEIFLKLTGKLLDKDHIMVYFIIDWFFTWSEIAGGLYAMA